MKGVTQYQLEILKHVAGASPAESLDFDQLLERLSWSPSKESAQFVIRAAITKGFLVKGDLQLRRGRKRVTYLLTAEGMTVLDPRVPAAPAATTSKLAIPETAATAAHMPDPEVFHAPGAESATTHEDFDLDVLLAGSEEFLEG